MGTSRSEFMIIQVDCCTTCNVRNVMLLTLEKQVKCKNGHLSTCMIVNSDVLIPIYPSASYTNSLIPPATTSAANLKWHTNLYFNPGSLPVLKSNSLTLLLPCLYFFILQFIQKKRMYPLFGLLFFFLIFIMNPCLVPCDSFVQ